MKRRLAILSLLLLPACGGSSPSAPNPTPSPTPTPTPSPTTINNMDAAGAPDIGTVIVVDECGGKCTTDVTIQILDTHADAVNPAEVYAQLFDGAGRQCATGFSAAVNLPAGRATEFLTKRLEIQCALPFTTTVLRASLLGPNPGNLPIGQRTALYAENFTGGWTFRAP